MHLQPRRKLREWCNRLTPARQLTSPPSEGVGRCVTLWCGLHVPHPPMLGCHTWVVMPGTFWLGAPVRGGSLEFFKALAPARGPGRRPKRAEEPPGRVFLGKGGEVCPVGSCQGQGPTTRPAEAFPKARAGDTPRYLGPYGPWMPLRLWSYLCGLSRAVGLGGFESGPALLQGSSWQFAAMVGWKRNETNVCLFLNKALP